MAGAVCTPFKTNQTSEIRRQRLILPIIHSRKAEIVAAGADFLTKLQFQTTPAPSVLGMSVIERPTRMCSGEDLVCRACR